MHVAADRPQEVFAAAEQLEFLAREHAAIDEFVGLPHAVDVFGDPEQRVQVAQAALAVLDIGLHQIARLAGAAVALLALGEFGGDEFGRGALHHFLVEARSQFVEQLGFAEQVARFKQRRAYRHVGLGLADAFGDRTRGVADLQAHVPEAIKQRFGNRLAPGSLFVRQQEQQIDVGARRHQSAAVPAGRHHRHLLGFGRHLPGIELGGDELEQDADDRVVHLAQPFGAAPAVPVLEQELFGVRLRGRQRGLQTLRHRGAQFALASRIRLGQRLKLGGERCAVDQRGAGAGGTVNIQHDRHASGAAGRCHRSCRSGAAKAVARICAAQINDYSIISIDCGHLISIDGPNRLF